MGDAAEQTPNQVYNALDEIIKARLVSYDAENRVLRYRVLPDARERAHTWQAIHGWWRRFNTVPQCPQRDAHVPLLKWMMDQGEVNEKMSDAWRQTFGTVFVPRAEPDFVAPSLFDNSTSVQPSLFSPPPKLDSNNSAPLLGSAYLGDSESDSESSFLDWGEADPDQRPRLRLVSGDEIARAEREAARSDLWDAVRAAGGDSLAPKL